VGARARDAIARARGRARPVWSDPTRGVSLSAEEAIVWTTRLGALSVLLLSLEALVARASYRDSGLLGFAVAQTRHPWFMHPRVERPMAALLGYRAFLGWILLRLLAAAVLLAAPLPLNDGLRTGLVLTLATTSVLLGLRTGFGMDGADQMTTLIWLALAVDATGGTALSSQAALWFIAAELTLSYLVAGVAKALGPEWRSGRAIWGVLSTRMYGVPPLGLWLQRRPRLCWLLCWSVILGESLFVLVFVLPPAGGAVLIAAGLSFHVGTAALMGLNTFLWAFLAAYPALLWAAYSPGS
jgi:hypothetical protein